MKAKAKKIVACYVRVSMKASPEKLVPADFRLHAESAGKDARKDGKDLGADVDFVGPGATYERLQKTPAYQEWRKNRPS